MHSGPEQANSISHLHKALKVKHKAKSLLFQSNHDKLLVFSAIKRHRTLTENERYYMSWSSDCGRKLNRYPVGKLSQIFKRDECI